MSKASIVVVEDEPLIADDILDTLERHGYEVVSTFFNGKKVLEFFEDNAPDLAILDVNIDGTMDGIELSKHLKVPFIFLTSYYDQKTLDRAKQVNPSGYIVKPFNERDLIANVEIALSRRKEKPADSKAPEKLFLKNGQEIISVMSSDIVYVEAFDNYANVFTEKEKFIISHTLKSVEGKLLPFGFMRVHRSYLINFAHVDSLSEGYVFLKGHKVQIGKSYRKDFIESLSML
ncbi:two component transcriptional regulator, LytTR family [Ekhidna lutea]|uniref:Two component transcriptional regulator, LytTR family n=1 Tax=Ekhidna lutea TaxID=447679 RepID=A0A239M3J4_EKHLU|nr:response regulator [Ekhidna lutea]SNT36718.1 two component transcriptional regulator, LytTR family [Ekhidna lutea]